MQVGGTKQLRLIVVNNLDGFLFVRFNSTGEHNKEYKTKTKETRWMEERERERERGRAKRTAVSKALRRVGLLPFPVNCSVSAEENGRNLFQALRTEWHRQGASADAVIDSFQHAPVIAVVEDNPSVFS